MSAMSGDAQLPAVYWNMLSQDDKNEYCRLRQSFHHGQKISSKDRRIVTFRKELNAVLHFLERSEENKEARCVLTGVCFAGKVVCVNTRQLKSFLARCKSSINGSFQQLGYVALRTKAKAKTCVITALPSLQNQQHILRQWTCRVVSEDAQFCFVSSFRHVKLPEINDEDLFEEKKPVRYYSQPLVSPQAPRTMGYGFQLPAAAPQTFKPKMLDQDLQEDDLFDPLGEPRIPPVTAMTHTFSADFGEMWNPAPALSLGDDAFDFGRQMNRCSSYTQLKGWEEDDMTESPLMPFSESLENFDVFGTSFM